jgi:hypothetical protein
LVPIVLAQLVLLAAVPAPELYYEQVTTTSVDGRASGPGVRSRVYYAGRKMRLEAGDAPGGPALVLRLDRNQAFRFDPERKTATALDVQRMRTRSQMDLSMAGDLMGGGEEGRARVAPLRTPRTIAGYLCHGYRITAPGTTLDLYVTSSLPVGIEVFAEFLEWTGANQSLAGLLLALHQVPGFPLETHSRTNVLGEVHETVATITRVRVGAQPAALFDVPAGFRVLKEATGQEEED